MTTTMERTASPVTEPEVRRSTERLRLATACLVIGLLVFTQSSGQEAADTKLDLAVSPWRFLVHSLRLWDPLAASGQVQDQSYGYLFPMGPFFLLGHLLHLSPWVVQRLWESTLLIVAFLGVVRLLRLIGLDSFWARLAGGVAYALAPRMLMEFGVISSELLPVVVAPWVLIPLIRGAESGSTRTAGARSGVALLFAGGINASATLSILPLPALWLLTRSRGPRRASLARWWVVSTVLASLWWAIPLVTLGRYASSFLDWIESASVTTTPTSLATSLSGSEHWEAYLGPQIWPAGHVFVTSRLVILATGLIAAAGIAGLLCGHVRHRSFWVWSALVGLVLLTFGHVSTIGPLFAGHEREALDGSLNALRNIHKFDPVLRLPIAVGVAHIVAVALRLPVRQTFKAGRGRLIEFSPLALAAMSAVAVGVVSIGPAVAGSIVPQTRVDNDPQWWSQVADWLAHKPGRALVVPGAAQPFYVWGAPRDVALQPLARSPWAVRDATPLGQAGYVRALDSVESSLAAGTADPTLSAMLTRMGIHYVLVRNDLDTAASGVTGLRFVHVTLRNSPGFRTVIQFGPDEVSKYDPGQLDDLGATVPQGSVTVYENTGYDGDLAVSPLSGAVHANGSADALPGLLDAGVAADQPVVFDGTTGAAAATGGVRYLDDGVRRRDFGFGSVDLYSATETASQSPEVQRAAHDYLPSPTPPLSTIHYLGIANVTASSSGAQAKAVVNRGLENGPFAAVDGSAKTAWRPGAYSGATGQWWQLDLLKPVSTTTATLLLAGHEGDLPDRIRVQTSVGALDQPISPDLLAQQIRLPAGATSFIRIMFTHVQNDGLGVGGGLAAVTVPGVLAGRELVVPSDTTPDVVSLHTAAGARSPCLAINGGAGCDESWAAAGEEDGQLVRQVNVASSSGYVAAARVRPRPGAALDRLLDAANQVRATASSIDSADPRERPGAAVDGRDQTGWVAASGDLQPTLTLHLPSRALVTGVRIKPISSAPVSFPLRATILSGAASSSVKIPSSGQVRFQHLVLTNEVSIRIDQASLRTSTDTVTGQTRLLPVGVGEVRLLGPGKRLARLLPSPASTVAFRCRSGPRLEVGGQATRMRAAGAVDDVLSGGSLTAKPCRRDGRVGLIAGADQLSLTQSATLTPLALTLLRDGFQQPAGSPTGSAQKLHWGATSREIRVSTRDPSLLQVHENANAGWHATLGGHTLKSVTIDGWQQGWILPAGANGVVQLTYQPQRVFGLGLIVGTVAVVLLLVLAVMRPRRHKALAVASDGRLSNWMVDLATVATLTLLGSVAGFVVGFVVVGAVRSRRGGSLPCAAVAGSLLIVVAIIAAIGPAEAAHPLAGRSGTQVLCLVALGLIGAVGGRATATARRGEPA